MLREPPTHIENTPAPSRPELPHDLAVLAVRARRDLGARRELADVLLFRRWTPDAVAATVDMTLDAVRALARVRRPGTDAGHVAVELVPQPRTATV